MLSTHTNLSAINRQKAAGSDESSSFYFTGALRLKQQSSIDKERQLCDLGDVKIVSTLGRKKTPKKTKQDPLHTEGEPAEAAGCFEQCSAGKP